MRRFPVRLRAEGCAVEVGFRKRQRTVSPGRRLPPSLILASPGRDRPCQPQGRGPALAGRRSLIGEVRGYAPAGHAPGAEPRSRETPGDLALPRGLLGASRLNPGSGARRLREREGRVPSREHLRARRGSSGCRSGRRKCRGTFPPAAWFLNHDFCESVARLSQRQEGKS